VGTSPCGFGASTNAQWLLLVPSSDKNIFSCSCSSYSLMMDPYPHPQHMKVVKLLSYVWNVFGNQSMWVWSLNQCAWLLLAPSSDLMFSPPKQIWADKCSGNGLMMDQYPHPQHMKVVKYLGYIWTGCGSQSMWVWSLNQCAMASLGAKQ
jgi:hypothetical protein